MKTSRRVILPLSLMLAGALSVQTSLALELELPIDLSDAGYLAYGVAPYGYHVAEHRYDGHPGIDIEFIPGRKVRAAHGGIFRYTVDSHDPALKSVTIEFKDNGINYQTFYTNIATLEPGIDNGVSVATGQIFGTPGSIVRNLGSAGSFTYAMTHFQLADNRVSYGLSNFSAVSPEPYFSTSARTALAQIWQQSQYHQMICEPFFSSSRGVNPYPTIIRRWRPVAGTATIEIEFICDFSSSDPNKSYRYRLIDTADNTIETGTAVVTAVVAGTSSLDLIPAAASARLGLIHVKDGAMELSYSVPGGSRPMDLSAATHYTTDAAASCASLGDMLCFKGNTAPYSAGDALTLSVSIDWTKPGGPVASANLWLALQLSSGDVLFRHNDDKWYSEPELYLSGINGLTSSVAIIDIPVPPGLSPGNFIFYALLTGNVPGVSDLNQAPLSNLASTLVYLAP